jgi:hypothetical protein
MPASVRQLASAINLHDATIQRIEVGTSDGRLRVILAIGDLQRGYYDLCLDYRGVSLASLDRHQLKELATGPEVEVLYDEVDTSGDEWVHRLLFWPYRDLDITFADLALSTTPRTESSRHQGPGAYAELPKVAV